MGVSFIYLDLGLFHFFHLFLCSLFNAEQNSVLILAAARKSHSRALKYVVGRYVLDAAS